MDVNSELVDLTKGGSSFLDGVSIVSWKHIALCDVVTVLHFKR